MRARLCQTPARLKSHSKDSDSFFGALGFTMPVEELTLRTASLAKMLDWLTQPQGPHLVDGSSTENPLMALAILIAPEALYDSDSPMVGLGLVYKAPYIQTTSWSEAYFDLKLASQVEAGNRPTRTKVIFVQIQASSQVIPLPGTLTLFLDVKTPEDITDSKAPRPPQDFRGFQLFQVVMKSEDPPATQVAVPRLQGRTECSWIPKQDQVLPPKLEEAPQITVPLSVANPRHWNIANDPIFPSCIATFRARHEATLASGTAASSGGASSQGGGSTPLQELPSASRPLPPPTPPLEWQEVDKRVTEVVDQVHDLQLLLLQEIGFVREIDQALSKSLMVEFLRLKVIIGDDLSGALRTWQTDMEVATDKLMRDLDAATQTSTTLPSKNAAVGVALRQFRAASQLRVALPLTQLDEAPPGLRAIGAGVRGLLRSEPLRHPEVAPLVLVGLAADRPIESNFFPSLLEGLLGSLGMAAPGESNPPVSSREGAGRAWSTAVRRAISQTEQKEVEAPKVVGLPPNLDLQYKESLLDKQRHLLPPIFSDPLFLPNMAKAVFRVAKPLVVSQALPAVRSREVSSAPPQPGGGGPEQQVLKSEESVPPRRFRSRSARLPAPIQTELTSPLRRRNRLVDPSRSDFPLNSLSVATRPRRTVPRMVSHPPKCARNQRPMRPGWASRPDPWRQPSRKLSLNCSKRTSPQFRRFVPGSSNSRREK